MEPILIGTNLYDIQDTDTVEQILKKIVSNQKSLFEQILEIVKFYNAHYTTDDNNADLNTTVNTGHIKSVSLKYGILYVYYTGVNGSKEVIKFRLDSALTDKKKGGPVYKLSFYGEDSKPKDFPNAEKGTYAYGNGHIYIKDDTGWTLVDEAYENSYFVYDNKLYQYEKDKGLVIAINAVHPDVLNDYATLEAVANALSEVEDNIANTYNRIFVLGAYSLSGYSVDVSTLKAGDYYFENNKVILYTGFGPGVEQTNVNINNAFFLYDNTLFSVVDGVYRLHIKNNDAYLSYLSTEIDKLQEGLREVEEKKTYILPIFKYTVDKGIPAYKSNIPQNSIAIDYNSKEKKRHWYKVVGTSFVEVELKSPFENDIEADKNVYLEFKGELWQFAKVGGSLINVVGNSKYNYSLEKVDRAYSKVIYGRVLDTIEEIEDSSEDADALLSGTRNKDDIYVENVLCLEDNNIWYLAYDHRFAYTNDAYNDVNIHIIFIDVDRGIYMKTEEGIYKCILSTDHISIITNKTSESSYFLVTAGAVVGALKKKADKVNAILEGIPTAPTAPVETDNDQIATTKFVKSIIAALSISTEDFNGTQVLNDINDLYEQKVEFLYVDYFIERGHNINELLHPTTGQRAIVINDENYPELYRYNSGSGWTNQGVAVNTELRKPFAIIAWDNKLLQWDRNNTVYRVLIDNTSVIDELWTQKAEFTYIDYIVSNLSEIEEPSVGQKAILTEEGEDPKMYVYRSNNTWNLQSEEVNAELKKKGTIIACNNSLYQWNTTAGQYIVLIDGNIGGGEGGSSDALNQLSQTSSKPVQSKVLYTILSNKANLDSPQFTGTPTAPTQASSSNDNSLATTRFVKNQLVNLRNAANLILVDLITDIEDDIIENNVNSAILIGESDVSLLVKTDENRPAIDINDYSQVILDTANLYVICDNKIHVWDTNEEWFKVALDCSTISTLLQSDTRAVSSAALYTIMSRKAPLNNPVFTGEPKAPTPSLDDESEKIATTRFVKAIFGQIQQGSLIPVSSGDTDTDSVDELVDNTQPSEVKRFNYLTGNPGTVILNKDAEDIEASDIDDVAFPLPPLYDNINDHKVVGEYSLWTAEDIGLVYFEVPSGNLTSAQTAIAKNNTAAVRKALNDPYCVGFKLDKVYYLYVTAAQSLQSAEKNKDPEKRIVIPRDFIIDGEVGGEAVGGFMSYQEMFYTEHSLVTNKCIFRKKRNDGSGYYLIYVNCSNGVNQLVSKDCIYETPNGLMVRVYQLYFENKQMYNVDNNYELAPDNYIDHIYFDGCTIKGGSLFISSDIQRVDKSLRIIRNVFEEVTANVAISITTNNSKTTGCYQGSYCSAPFFIVDNEFTGSSKVSKSSAATYYTPYCIETAELYAIGNRTYNFIGGTYYYNSNSSNTQAAYDHYFNGQRLHFHNNETRNVITIASTFDVAAGLFKSKGLGLPGGLRYNEHSDVFRHYTNNSFVLDEAEIATVWNNRTYRTGAPQEEIDNDDSIVLANTLIVKWQGLMFGYGSTLTTQPKIALKEYIVKNNTINLGNGALTADSLGDMNITATNTVIEGNIITAAKICSDEYAIHGTTTYKRWLLPIWIVDYYGPTSLTIKNNMINVPNSNIHLFLAKYNSANTVHGYLPAPVEADENNIEGNSCGANSTILIKRYDISKSYPSSGSAGLANYNAKY